MRELIIGIVLIVEGLGASVDCRGFGWEERCPPPNYVDAKNVKLDYGQALVDGGKLIFKKVRKTSSFKTYFFLKCSNLWAKT